MFAQHLRASHADPGGGWKACFGAPEGVEGERAEDGFEILSEAVGRPKNAEGFVPVCGVIRLWSDTVGDIGALIEPPEKFGGAKILAPGLETLLENIVECGCLNQVTRLLPESDLASIKKVPAIADHSVFLRQFAGQHGGLSTAGYGRENLVQAFYPAGLSQCVQTGSVGEQSTSQAHSV